MRRRLAAAALLFAVGLAAGVPAATAGADTTLYAVGDIHGALTAFDSILARAGLAATPGRWSGGDATLVQTGDFTDRGAEVRGVMDRLRSLQEQAAAAGGRVVVLYGNHELMNLVRQYRDANPEAFARFADGQSEKRRRRAWSDWKRFWRRREAELGHVLPERIARTREQWLTEHPPGLLEYQEAFGPAGEYGAWLRSLGTAVRVDRTLLLHGGLSPELAASAPEALTAAVHEEIARFDQMVRRLEELGVILPSFDLLEIARALDFTLAVAEATGTAETPAAAELAAFQADLGRLSTDWISFRSDGPLWYRGYAQLDDWQLADLLDDTFASQAVDRVVTGHTPSASASIRSRLGGRLYLIDTGMLSEVYPNGRAAVLEVAGGRAAAIYPDERRPLTGAVEAAAGGGYLMVAAPQQPPAPRGPPPLVRRFVGPNGPLPFASEAEVVHFLRTARVTGVKDIGQGITHPKRLTLELDGVVARAVFHDVDQHERGLRLRGRGIVADFRDSYRSQVAGYRVARLLGFELVPPAALREHDGVRGSAALWIEDAMDERQRLERGERPPDPLRWQRRFHDMRVYDNLIRNIDRNQTNIMIDGEWRVWLIDTTRAFGTGADLSYPDQLLRCSRELWQAIRDIDLRSARSALADVLTGPEIKALIKRRDRVVAALEKRIAKHGEERVLFRYEDPPDNVRIDGADPTEVPPPPPPG